DRGVSRVVGAGEEDHVTGTDTSQYRRGGFGGGGVGDLSGHGAVGGGHLFLELHFEHGQPVGGEVDATHEGVPAGEPVVVGTGVENIEQVAVLVLGPHAVAGAELPVPVVHTGMLDRIVQLRPCPGVGQVRSLPCGCRGEPGGVGVADGGAGIDQVEAAIVGEHVGALGDRVVPRVFRGDDAHRIGSEAGGVGRVHGGDEDRAEHLPGVIGLPRVFEVGHVEGDLLDRVEDGPIGAEYRFRGGPTVRVGRVQVVALSVLLQLHDAGAAGPHVGGAVAAVVAGHEQDGQGAVDHVQLWGPEAPGHRPACRVGVTGTQQVVFGGATLGQGLIGEICDAVGHPQWH